MNCSLTVLLINLSSRPLAAAQRRVQDFDSMFSANPQFAVQLSAVDPLPASLDRRWPGTRERPRHSLGPPAG